MKDGYTGDVICSTCSKIIPGKQGETISATGIHAYLDGVCTMCQASDPDYKPSEKVEMGTTDAMKDALAIEATNITNNIDADGKLTEAIKVNEDTKAKIEEVVADTASDDSVTLVFVVEQVATPIAENEVSEETTTAIETKLDETANSSVEKVEDQGVVQYLDLSVVIKAQIQSNNPSEETKTTTMGELEETTEEMEFTITIPTEYLKPGYELFVLRYHQGDVTILPLMHVEGNIYSFKTNLFSTYALAYTHTHVETIINAKAANCGNDGYTGDKVCSTCNEVLEVGSNISASGDHAWSEWMHLEGQIYEFRNCETCDGYEARNIDVPTIDNTVSNNVTTNITAPATGDTSNVSGWLVLMVLCSGVLFGTVVYRKKR